ncbi:L-threonine 3-dehydrogenase [Salpingoeca rosetta]|uniref:L-threonine 3-dehydrogenase n=1 Tax=Salpingoeca rosetta (strain ATCC 50818 / BSB-021) TaxID=946362 RepID=F2UDM4_SALR5|nr:L-threonine 3-dehydrogenase [Salpingoeca rosetta]EGD74719.1 L-threonine 3-dehydrogenase [Salpingoeca rosetta]|eukprot:XP_004992976.1 L-threonine 3-dehydrogenase [Salpingoeca rosetta]
MMKSMLAPSLRVAASVAMRHAMAPVAQARFMATKNASPVPELDYSHFPTIPGTSMRCLKKQERKEGLWLDTAEHPQIKPHEILINVKRAAICGTDVHIYNWDEWSEKTVPTPMITGHEYSGVIAEVGSEVEGFKVGDRVTGEGHLVCGHCRNCRGGRQHLCRNTFGIGVNRPGAFADYFALPASNAFKLPDAITDETAAIMDPLGNAVHCALSFDLVGEDVLITGAGPIGIMAAAVCRHVGARHVVVTDVNDYRLGLAKQCGATVALNVAAPNSDELLHATMKNLGMTEGFDVGLEMSGHQSGLRDMLNSMNSGGRIAILGIPSTPFPIELDKIVFKGLTVKGIYGREMYETWYKMANMLVAGLQERIAPVITHRLPFENFEEGFQAMRKGEAVKVVLEL